MLIMDRLGYAIDIIEELQNELEILEPADIYDVLDEVLRVLMAIEVDT